MARRPTSRGPAANPFLSPQERRERSWLSRHPGANRPGSPNYDPNWKQRARGHKVEIREGVKVSEHVTRRERAEHAGRVTEQQSAAIRRFADKQAKRQDIGLDRDEVYRDLKQLADVHGFAAFERVRDATKRLSRRRRVRVERWKRRDLKVVQFEGEIRARGAARAEMEAIAAAYGIDWRLLYYH
jgi:hypothetical protein